MPLSTDITLPKEIKPKFPDKCIVSGNSPDSKIHITQNSANWFLSFFMPILMLFGFSKVEIPICEECKTRFRLQRWSRELVSWVLVIIAIWTISPYFSTWPSLTKKIVVGCIAILFVIPSAIIEVLWPRVFTTTAKNNKVDYEFSDEEYAREFYNLNKSDVIKSDFD